MTELLITNTLIQTLVLDQLAPYTDLWHVTVDVYPVTAVVPSTVPLTLTVLEIRDAAYPSRLPPEVGNVKAQLEYLTLERSNLQQVPDGFFSGYGSLISLSLAENDIDELGAGVLTDLRGLQYLYLTGNPLSKLILDTNGTKTLYGGISMGFIAL